MSQTSSTVSSGLVISQSPTAGSSVPAGSAVNLVVSSGAAAVTTPSVVGQTQAAAQTAIVAAGLKVGTIEDLISYRIRHDKIVRLVTERSVTSAFGGEFTLRLYATSADPSEHIALIKGDVTQGGVQQMGRRVI